MKGSLLLVILMAVLVGCAPAPAPAPSAIVATGIAPLATMAAALLDDPAAVVTVLEPGESPATFDPSPRRLASLEQVRIYFACGVPMENQLLPRLRQGRPELEIVDVTAGLARIPLDDHGHHHSANHDHGEDDPHLWLDPDLMRAQVRVMAIQLAKLLPASTAGITARADSLDSLLVDLGRRVRSELAPVRGRDMFVFHPAFGYLAHACGLRQVALEQGGLDPSPRHLARVLEGIGERGARAVFVQPQFSRGSARSVARETGVRLIVLDPLDPDYPANLDHMAHTIREALDDRP